ncbi:MAG TPA: nitronate monooxygenase, partial [Acidimicrobiia bacterium]|nr:nitronate monooxygenase [Acidimicrobiia bacterium]
MPWPTGFTDLIGCRYPLQQAAMGGAPQADLAVAVAAAGGLGMLSGTIGEAALEAQLSVVPDGAAVGVNFLVPFIDPAAVELAAARSRYVEFFWAAPSVDLVRRGQAGGARVGWQTGSLQEARTAADAGCDLIVVQGLEAGGHVRGTVALLPLLEEVRGVVNVPVVAAGGIGSGRTMAAALLAGADGVRV